MEEWREIEGYTGDFSVSNLGRVRSNINLMVRNGRHLFVGKILNPSKIAENARYLRIGLTDYRSGVRKSWNVHRLVAEAFIPNPENKPAVNHINGNRNDNTVHNLEWVTYSENAKHAHTTGLAKPLRGKDKTEAKYSEELIKEILYLFYHKLLTPSEIEVKLNLPNKYVHLIVKGERWFGVFEEYVSENPDYYKQALEILKARRSTNRLRVEGEVIELQKRLAQ